MYRSFFFCASTLFAFAGPTMSAADDCTVTITDGIVQNSITLEFSEDNFANATVAKNYSNTVITSALGIDLKVKATFTEPKATIEMVLPDLKGGLSGKLDLALEGLVYDSKAQLFVPTKAALNSPKGFLGKNGKLNVRFNKECMKFDEP